MLPKQVIFISIHTPREGSDEEEFCLLLPPLHFNPHSPRGERRAMAEATYLQSIFQSTLPARGATPPGESDGGKRIFQSTLPARGATRNQCVGFQRPHISIHTPREGSDLELTEINSKVLEFQSTLPARGATSAFVLGRGMGRNFNPHSPRGERLDSA